MAAACVGWLFATALIYYLVLVQKRWRTAFETKEWLILPSTHAATIESRLHSLGTSVQTASTESSKYIAAALHASKDAASQCRGAREEFQILREEIDLKQKEIKMLQIGMDFHYRRPVLMRILKALDIIKEDQANNRELQTTIAGVMVELAECLEDNQISEHHPTVGAVAATEPGFDLGKAERIENPDEQKKGTIAAVLRPGYAINGALGKIEILVPARVQVFI